MRGLLLWVFIVACTGPRFGDPAVEPVDTAVSTPAPYYINPVAVGFEFDGVLHPDGSLTGYTIDGEYYEPTVYVVFASEKFFSASSEEVETEESCYAWGDWVVEPTAKLTTFDGLPLFYEYEGTLELDWYTCADMVDPAVWGPDGEDLIYAFQNLHLGFGPGTFTPGLRGAWSEEILELYEPSMLAGYYAINGADQSFIAEDVTTTFAWEVDPDTSELSADEFGNLIPVAVDDLRPPDVLPLVYIRSIATYYVRLEELDLTNLDQSVPGE